MLQADNEERILSTIHQKGITRVAWSPDGTRIATGDQQGIIHVWDVKTGKCLCTFEEHRIRGMWHAFTTISILFWSPDNTRIASAANNMSDIYIWDATSAKLLAAYTKHGQALFAAPISVIWFANSQWIASTNGSLNDNYIHIWNPYNGEQIQKLTYPAGNELMLLNFVIMKSIALSPDNKSIACSCDKTLRILSIDKNSAIVNYPKLDSDIVLLTWSPNGKYLASLAKKDITIWDTQSFKKCCTYSEHSHSISTIKWSPDSEFIASSAINNTVHIWHALTAKRFAVYNQRSWATWSPDGKYLASIGVDNKTICIWPSRLPQNNHQSTKPPAHNLPDRQLSRNECLQLAQVLSSCHCMQDSNMRDSLVQRLPDEIQNSLTRSSRRDFDIQHIVDGCNNYPQGLQTLLHIVQSFEHHSHAFIAINQLLQTFQ